MNKYFVINTYDTLTATIIHTLLSTHQPVALLLNNQILNPQHELNVDEYINTSRNDQRKIGSVSNYGNYRLYDDSLRQRSKISFARLNILLNPESRLKIIFDELKDNYGQLSILELDAIVKSKIANTSDSLIKSYLFHYFLSACHNAAAQQAFDISNTVNFIYTIALAYVLAYDYTDIPVPGKHIRFESIIHDKISMNNFSNSILQLEHVNDSDSQKNNSLSNRLKYFHNITSAPLAPNQIKLYENMIHKNLHSIYYPHLSKSLYQLYQSHDYYQSENNLSQPNFKLISIQLNSNRPGQLITYFDNIEDTADCPELIEIIINVDDDDHHMHALLTNEIKRRKFTIKYTTSPKPSSFCDLWMPINQIYKLTDPNAYFLLNISDEMIFADKGWDTRLKKYVDFYPDGLFRLRASRNKVRAYFDRWECSFAQDSIPITTKKWVDVGGNWNPCFGPDSFQQLVAFYLAKEGAFSNEHYLRDIPVFDIRFQGDVPSLGMEPSKHWKHIKNHIDAMFIFHSQPMLEEARRRAILIKANIMMYGKNHYSAVITDDKAKKSIKIIDVIENKVIAELSYKVGRLSTTITNNIRKLNYFLYFGDGNPRFDIKTPFNFIKYLRARHISVYRATKLIGKAYLEVKEIVKSFTCGVEIRFFKLKNLLRTKKNNLANYNYSWFNPNRWIKRVIKSMYALLKRNKRPSKLFVLQKEVESLRTHCNELLAERAILLNKLSLYEKSKLSA